MDEIESIVKEMHVAVVNLINIRINIEISMRISIGIGIKMVYWI